MTETVDQRVVWNSAQPGDPRPPRHDGKLCREIHTPSWMACTRLKGHSGQHVATGPRKVFEVWSGEPS